MNKTEAVAAIAADLKNKAEGNLEKARMMLGNRAEITANEIDFDAEAERILEDAIVTAAYERITNASWSSDPYRSGPPMPAMPPR